MTLKFRTGWNRDNRNGIPMQAVILFETGGVRLQEANLGLAAIAEIQSAIVDLRRYRPVIGVSAGTVGCYGGMSIAAGLCSYLVLTREARLGLNGPQVIEQEAGLAEFDSRNRALIWGLTGGEQRCATCLADVLVDCVEGGASVSFKYDATPPSASGSLSRGPDHNGWYNQGVTVAFSGSDGVSGPVAC